ncbi:MAG: sulfotransferase [Methylococcales bacterium]|nr:sulfotransferase [Methylococcales bacterium]
MKTPEKDLNSLRKKAEYQQFSPLKEACLLFKQHFSSPAIYPLLALAHAHLGEFEQSEKNLAFALKHRAEMDAEALIDLAAVYMLKQDLDFTVEILQHALNRQPKHALGLARLGWCRLQQQQLKDAHKLFSQAAELAPERISILTYLAQTHYQLADYPQAQLTITQALQTLEHIKKQLPDVLFQRYQQQINQLQLQLWVSQQHFAQAEHWLQQQKETLDDEDSCVDEYIQYSVLLAEHDLHQQAVEILSEELKHFKDNIRLLTQLAELSQIQGHTLQAICLLKRAISQDEENSALWVQLSSVCLHNASNEARHAAIKAGELTDDLNVDETHPQPLIDLLKNQAKNALAMVESQEQNYSIAENLFNEIIQEQPYFLPALQGLGQQQMQCGNIDEALVLFETVKKIDPVKGYSSLINARSFPDDDKVLEQLEKVANLPSLEGSLRTGILFQLIAVWEKRKDYNKAFEFAIQANQATKRLLSYNAKVHRQQCAQIRSSFCKALYQHRPNYGHKSTLPVYILGMPRSGTTLVEQIISGHSKIFGAGELGVIPNIVQGLNRWERHVGSERSYPDCIDDLTQHVSHELANKILKELQEYDPHAQHVVDKLPHNFENIGLIKFLFPNAKIISVRRDPRDIAISNYFTDYQAKHGGMGFAYDLTHIGEQLADHNQMMQHWKDVFPNQILEINYEAVVDDLEGSAHKLLAHIGVDWEPDVLRFNELNRPVKTASVWQVRQPVYKSSKARWLHYQNYLEPLIKGTNAKISFDPVEMITLPEAGFLTRGVDLFRQQKLDKAEISFKKMLHHNPEHAACHYMLGLVYLRKGYLNEGIEKVEIALDKVPWQDEWRETLIKAYEMAGMDDKVKKLDGTINPAK